jgi:hypothetical protein
MPIYEYRCNHCGAASEFFVGVRLFLERDRLVVIKRRERQGED